jgi:membrane protein
MAQRTRKRDSSLGDGRFDASVMVLLGAEFNAELERGRAIEAGMPKEEKPFVEPRDTRKMDPRGRA